MEAPGSPERVKQRKPSIEETVAKKRSHLALEMQPILNRLLDEPSVDWDQVRELCCYSDCLNPNRMDVSSRLTTVHRAAFDGDAAVVRWCLEARANVDAASNIGRTALHYACNGNRPTCVRVLLEHGANVNAVSLSGQTPLHLCCQYNKYEAALELFHTSCEVVDIDAEDSHRRIPEQLTQNALLRRAIRQYRGGLDERLANQLRLLAEARAAAGPPPPPPPREESPPPEIRFPVLSHVPTSVVRAAAQAAVVAAVAIGGAGIAECAWAQPRGAGAVAPPTKETSVSPTRRRLPQLTPSKLRPKAATSEALAMSATPSSTPRSQFTAPTLLISSVQRPAFGKDPKTPRKRLVAPLAPAIAEG